ncbi:hypothetical protein D8B24_19625 [Verminephrobacter aporrectodeae subsp. tuberculatae]|nr:hypothetical protein [Verminephrobacter aporrectodeae subsp. tuberculatae]
MRRDTSQRTEPKATYRVKNWAQYNAGLIARGDITVWIDKSLLTPAPAANVSRRGRPIVYPDAVIQSLLSRDYSAATDKLHRSTIERHP